MKIFQVISSLGNGGAEKLVVELSNELAKSNEVSIISIKSILSSMFHVNNISEKVGVYALDKRKGFDLYVLVQLFRILREERPNIVHIHLNMTLLYFLLIVPFFKNIKFYYTIHSDIDPHKKLFNRYILLPYFRRIVFICLSPDIKNRFQTYYSSLKFEAINSGISPIEESMSLPSVIKEFSLYRKNHNTKVFLFVGRLSYAKNIPLLIEVFKEIAYKNVSLVIIGKGDLKVEEAIASEQGLDSSMFYVGPKANVGDYLSQADALVLTSRYEGLPIVVLEALSVGLPIISTPVGCLPSIIGNRVNGFLSKTGHKKDIIDAIDLFLSLSINERDKIAINNKTLFEEQFSITICSNKHISLYHNN